MAVAINTTGTLNEPLSATSVYSYSGLTIPGSLANVAYFLFITTAITGELPGWVVAGITGLTQLGKIIHTGFPGVTYLYAALLGSPAGSTPVVTLTWTGGTPATLEVLGLALTGVNQTSIAAAFTNLTTFGPTLGTNPTMNVTTTTTGFGIVAFATTASGDITDVTVGGSSVVIAGAHGNLNSINWNAGSRAGTGAAISFVGVEGTSQDNWGIGINVEAAGDILMGAMVM